MLTNFTILELKKRKFTRTLIQQDGATCYTAGKMIPLLKKHSRTRLISGNNKFSWPPRSTEFVCLRLLLWGYLKSRMYEESREISSN
ncbi:hypothetical protein PGB90_008402 [Kerria lacca]